MLLEFLEWLVSSPRAICIHGYLIVDFCGDLEAGVSYSATLVKPLSVPLLFISYGFKLPCSFI